MGRSPGEGNLDPLFLPGDFHGQRSLKGCNPCVKKRVRRDGTTPTHTSASTSTAPLLCRLSVPPGGCAESPRPGRPSLRWRLIGGLEGFPGRSGGEESACNVDLGLIPALGRLPGEETGCLLQYSCAFLVSQVVKNPPAMWGTWFQSLGWEDPLEEGMATPSSVLAWRIPWTEEAGGPQSRG